MGAAVFGGGLAFYVVQSFTAPILILAANTAYQDFPRLSSILARDRFMPRQFMNRGDRLVFSNGVLVLGGVSRLVILAFNADLTRLIQLYVVGVFTSFTLSQTGMVRHWLKEKHKGAEAQRGWQLSIVINAIGAVTTGVVLVVVTITKFAHGAWLSILAMILIVPTFKAVHRHYTSVMAQLRRGTVRPGAVGVNHAVLLVTRSRRVRCRGARLRPRDPTRRHPRGLPHDRGGGSAGGPGALARVRRRIPIELEPLAAHGGDLVGAMREYLRRSPAAASDFVTVVVPEQISQRSGVLPAAESSARPPQGRAPARAERRRHRCRRSWSPTAPAG